MIALKEEGGALHDSAHEDQNGKPSSSLGPSLTHASRKSQFEAVVDFFDTTPAPAALWMIVFESAVDPELLVSQGWVKQRTWDLLPTGLHLWEPAGDVLVALKERARQRWQ